MEHIQDFIADLNVDFIDWSLVNMKDVYTYRVLSTSANSFIDHFAVTKSCLTSVSNVRVIDDVSNFSDHCPLICAINLNVTQVTGCANRMNVKNAKFIPTAIRWINLISIFTKLIPIKK